MKQATNQPTHLVWIGTLGRRHELHARRSVLPHQHALHAALEVKAEATVAVHGLHETLHGQYDLLANQPFRGPVRARVGMPPQLPDVCQVETDAVTQKCSPSVA